MLTLLISLVTAKLLVKLVSVISVTVLVIMSAPALILQLASLKQLSPPATEFESNTLSVKVDEPSVATQNAPPVTRAEFWKKKEEITEI